MGMTALETRLEALAGEFARAVMQLAISAPVSEIVAMRDAPAPSTTRPAPTKRTAPRSVEASVRSVETRRLRELMEPSIVAIEGLLRARGPHKLEELQRVLQLEAETLASAIKVALEAARVELRTKGGESRYRLGPKSSRSLHAKPSRRRSRAAKRE